MAWTKLDDRFWCHPKIMGLSDGAFRLYVTTLNWAVANLTDGHVPTAVLREKRMRNRNSVTEELVNCGLWDEHETDGYVIHDYAEYQPTKEAITQLRQQNRDRQRRFRDAQSDPDVTRDKRVSNADVTSTRPDPTPLTSPNGDVQSSKRSKPKPAKPDPIFEAVYAATNGRPWKPGTQLTASARGRYNTAAKQLRDIGATPDDIATAAARYRDEWPDMELTPLSLVTNWDRFTGERVTQCNHRWTDGRSAWAATTRGGVDMTRCDKCGEVRK